jgi:hypothetical protein
MVLRNIDGCKMEEVIGNWRNLYNELHDFYSSKYVISVIKLKWIGWVGIWHVPK